MKNDELLTFLNNYHKDEDPYFSLKRVLEEASEQAISGKGRERHASEEPYEQQKICTITRWVRLSPVAGPLFQAIKKAVESSRLDAEHAIFELQGTINYLAAAIIVLEEERGNPFDKKA